jgi:hypothetical protein
VSPFVRPAQALERRHGSQRCMLLGDRQQLWRPQRRQRLQTSCTECCGTPFSTRCRRVLGTHRPDEKAPTHCVCQLQPQPAPYNCSVCAALAQPTCCSTSQGLPLLLPFTSASTEVLCASVSAQAAADVTALATAIRGFTAAAQAAAAAQQRAHVAGLTAAAALLSRLERLRCLSGKLVATYGQAQ